MGAKVILAAGVSLIFAAAAPTPAQACINGVYHETNWRVRVLARADRLIDLGRYKKAVHLARRAVKRLRKPAPLDGLLLKHRRYGLTRRALRIGAAAAIYSDGRYAMWKKHYSKDPQRRLENIRWAVSALKQLSAKLPAQQTMLAIGMSKLPDQKEAAGKLLQRLYRKDLIASAAGYLALARIRDAAKDEKSRDAALKQCTKMTRRPKACAIDAKGTPLPRIARRARRKPRSRLGADLQDPF